MCLMISIAAPRVCLICLKKIKLVQPLILTFTDATGLGTILTIAGFGYLAGAVIIGSWGGPERKIYAVFSAALVMGIGMSILPLTIDTKV